MRGPSINGMHNHFTVTDALRCRELTGGAHGQKHAQLSLKRKLPKMGLTLLTTSLQVCLLQS